MFLMEEQRKSLEKGLRRKGLDDNRVRPVMCGLHAAPVPVYGGLHAGLTTLESVLTSFNILQEFLVSVSGRSFGRSWLVLMLLLYSPV